MFEIGGPEVLDYVDMMRRVAAIKNGRRCRSCRSRCSPPRLSSLWLALVTDVDPRDRTFADRLDEQ